MTAKRNRDGELEVVKIGNTTFTYRTALLALILAATPLGDGVFEKLGIGRKVEVNSPAIERIDAKVDKLKEQVGDLDSDVHKLSATVAEIKRRLDNKSELSLIK